jgi:hypothetical protein
VLTHCLTLALKDQAATCLQRFLLQVAWDKNVSSAEEHDMAVALECGGAYVLPTLACRGPSSGERMFAWHAHFSGGTCMGR